MKLRFKESQIKNIANRYDYIGKEFELEQLADKIQKTGSLSKDNLRLIAQWKSPRSAGNVEKNSETYIKEITSFVFSTDDERARIQTLTILDGVLWPTASVILHLFHTDPYPILDFRALWSANTEVPKQYSYDFWESYVHFCRKIAKRNKVTMRNLDRAMWQYSKENQPA